MIGAISDEDAIMIVIDRKAPWILELAWSVAFLSKLGHERGAIIVAREYLHSMVVGVNRKQEASMMVERQAKKVFELAISIAFLLGANRERDSSIAAISHPLGIHVRYSRSTG